MAEKETCAARRPAWSRLALTAALLLPASLLLPAALFGSPFDKEGQALLDLDVAELPPQVRPPAPGDTDWPFYNRTIDGERFSPLDQINAETVGALREVCRVRVSGPGPFSAGTLLANGMLYTTAANATIAIEPTSCDVVWKAIYSFDGKEIYNANRGVAQMDGRLFRGTGDGRLVAYDAFTGRELWRSVVGDPQAGEYVSAAPLAWDGKVYVGIAAGDLGIAGRVSAFDARTGRKLWSFNTVPHPGEFGNASWPGETWRSGGGGTWSTYTLDPQTGELFIPVANPAPSFDPDARRGDNLFTNSALVIDARSGAYRWHYQALPNDGHDYGVSPPGILIEPGGRPMLAQASKDGFLYMVDRASRRLAWKAPVTTIVNYGAKATPQGVRICPGAKGGVEYNSPGFDPQSGLLVVGAVDWCYFLTRTPYGPHVPGQPYTGGRMDRGDPVGKGWVTAIDAATGKVRWKFPTPAPVIGGVTPTAGGLTFVGDTSGLLYVLRTRDGALMRKIDTGGAIAGGIITYRIRGRQYLAVSSGNISRSSWTGATGIPTQIVYALPDGDGSAADPAGLAPDIARGRAVYATSCAVCHGAAGEGGAGLRLAGIGERLTQAQVAAYVANPGEKMPRLYPGSLSAQDVADVAGFARTLR